MNAKGYALMLLGAMALLPATDMLRADDIPYAAISAGAETDALTGSLQNVGQTVIGLASNGSVIMHAGIIPALAGRPSPTPPVITGWRSARQHVGLGELAIELDPAAAGIAVVGETRRDGIQKIEVDITGPADGSMALTGTVEAEDLTNGGSIPATSQTLTHHGGGSYTLIAEWSGGLPDQVCYKIDLAANIPDLIDDTDCLIKALEGDTNGDNYTDLIDMAQVKSKNGSPVAGDDVRLDVNLDGHVDLIDMAMVKSLNGGWVACP